MLEKLFVDPLMSNMPMLARMSIHQMNHPAAMRDLDDFHVVTSLDGVFLCLRE